MKGIKIKNIKDVSVMKLLLLLCDSEVQLTFIDKTQLVNSQLKNFVLTFKLYTT